MAYSGMSLPSVEQVDEEPGDMLPRALGLLELLDPSTRAHSAGVMRLVASLGSRLGIDGRYLKMLSLAGLLHDLGKVVVPDWLLNKPGRLSHHERMLIQSHPVAGAEMLRRDMWDPQIVLAVRHHHERFDGRGYPQGLEGEAIPLASRVIAVADAFDAMTSRRAYRAPLKVEDAVREILHHRGEQFDPLVAHALADLMGVGPQGNPDWDELDGPVNPHGLSHRELMHSVGTEKQEVPASPTRE